MENVSTRLRDLRKSAVPRVTVRSLAADLGMPLGTYSFYESPTKFKKAALPLDLTRKIAAVLARHGVDPAEVMKLAGLGENEAEPEARAVEAARAPVQYVSLAVALPSEAALAAMFETLLALIPEEATKAEAARILAQQLPVGFAAIGPAAMPQHPALATTGAAIVPVDAKDDPAPPQPSRN